MKIRKELWFGFTLMAIIIMAALTMLGMAKPITNGHIGLLMLSLVVVAIMLGFPTAFTLMGMGMIFTWIAYNQDIGKTLDLMVQAAFKVMGNDVLISIPLFVFMGYLVERANLIEKLFRSLHLALARVPGALAVATLVTCAVFATATGIVGAVVTLMGLLALPAMLRGGYSVQLSAGAITAGGCLGILIPPSVMLIVYGATAGVSVVQLYAGAFLPGLMLAGLYIAYVIIIAKLRPSMAPPLSAAERFVPLVPMNEKIAKWHGENSLTGLLTALKGGRNKEVPSTHILKQLAVVFLPLILFAMVSTWSYKALTTVQAEEVQTMERIGEESKASSSQSGLAEPPSEGVKEPAAADGLKEPPSDGLKEPGDAAKDAKEPPVAQSSAPAKVEAPAAVSAPPAPPAAATRVAAPAAFWYTFAGGAAVLALFYGLLSFTRLEVFKMLLSSFFPLLVLILSVLGSIVMGLATPTEAAAVGALGGLLLAAAYRQLTFNVVKESVYLTAKTSAMVCWLFVGSAIFSAAFALLGGQELVEQWVLSMNLSKTQFLILSQVIIFVLGWPLEWTEIIVIFMPIFIPLLDKFGVDPLFFGLLVALNLQTAFLSPPVAMAAFYLKGVSPPHVTLNQIFAGMLPFMGIQIIAIVLLYMYPQIGLWLPSLIYK
jgi:TRAP-type mannitol/chloroaromatic compound transport system permease large subunit